MTLHCSSVSGLAALQVTHVHLVLGLQREKRASRANVITEQLIIPCHYNVTARLSPTNAPYAQL